MIDPGTLHELLMLEADTGRLFWKERSKSLTASPDQIAFWNRRFAGKEAFTSITKQGYRLGTLLAENLYAHRVVYAMSHGRWPAGMIDHINGNRLDNRIENLRDANAQTNSFNSRQRANGTGFKGVSLIKGKYVAALTLNGKRIVIGRFASAEEAHQAYVSACNKHHGDFSYYAEKEKK